MGYNRWDESLFINVDIFIFDTQLFGDLFDGDTELIIIFLQTIRVKVLLNSFKVNVFIDECIGHCLYYYLKAPIVDDDHIGQADVIELQRFKQTKIIDILIDIFTWEEPWAFTICEVEQ